MSGPCSNVRPLSWDPGLCVCGAMVEAHATLSVCTTVAPQPLSFHVYQDVDDDSGAQRPGIEVEVRRDGGERTIGLSWGDAPADVVQHELTLDQAEQLRDLLTTLLEAAPAKQDPAADAIEDEAYAQAVASATARMNEAEARETRAEREARLAALRDAFRAHLDTCPRCSSGPFNLCDTGAKLLERVGGAT